jgi:hypothetical protein
MKQFKSEGQGFLVIGFWWLVKSLNQKRKTAKQKRYTSPWVSYG